MAGKTFIEKCISGEAKIDQVDDYVHQWHTSPEGVHLHEYLGMTEKQYNIWALNPDILEHFVEEYKKASEEEVEKDTISLDEWNFSFGLMSSGAVVDISTEDCDELMNLVIDWAEKKGYGIGGGYREFTDAERGKKTLTKIWYSVENCGDGSAYPTFMESEELCEIDQRFMDEGWGESCTGYIEIESDSPIAVKSKIVTLANKIKEIEDELNEDYMKEYKKQDKYPDWFERLEGHLAALIELRDQEK